MKTNHIFANKFINISGSFENLKYIQLLYKYSELYGIVSKNKKDRLSEKENEFFILCVMYSIHDLDLNNSEVKKELAAKMGFTSYRSVYQYIDKLLEKGWLVKIKKGFIEVIPQFKLAKDLEGINFNVVLQTHSKNNVTR